jgi:hypothetical protein
LLSRLCIAGSSHSAAQRLLLRATAAGSCKEMYFCQISGLARGHDCGVPDVAAVNMMRGFLHDHRGKQTDRLPHTLLGRSALEFILSNDVAVPEKDSLRDEQSSAMVHSCQQASWTACQRSFAGLQQGCKAMVRQWYFLTRTRWSNGPRSRLADPESGGVPDVDSQQEAARAAICRTQINILPLIFHLGCESGRSSGARWVPHQRHQPHKLRRGANGKERRWLAQW